MSAGVTAVVAQTQDAARELAHELGIVSCHVFGARSAATFEGLRAGLVIVDAAADLEPGFMDIIRATVLKAAGPRGGRVMFVSRDAPPSPPLVLQQAFWEALKRCTEDPRVHPMDEPYAVDPRIDGTLPDEMWEHMAEVLADRARRGA